MEQQQLRHFGDHSNKFIGNFGWSSLNYNQTKRKNEINSREMVQTWSSLRNKCFPFGSLQSPLLINIISSDKNQNIMGSGSSSQKISVQEIGKEINSSPKMSKKHSQRKVIRERRYENLSTPNIKISDIIDPTEDHNFIQPSAKKHSLQANFNTEERDLFDTPPKKLSQQPDLNNEDMNLRSYRQVSNPEITSTYTKKKIKSLRKFQISSGAIPSYQHSQQKSGVISLQKQSISTEQPQRYYQFD